MLNDAVITGIYGQDGSYSGGVIAGQKGYEVHRDQAAVVVIDTQADDHNFYQRSPHEVKPREF